MIATYRNIYALLTGTVLLLTGVGLLNTLLGVRAGAEGMSTMAVGVFMSAYFAGYLVSVYVTPGVVRNVGHIRTFAAYSAGLAVSTLLHGLYVDPVGWMVIRFAAGFCVLGLYLVIESWLVTDALPESRGTLLGVYVTLSLSAICVGQGLLGAADIMTLDLFAVAALFITLALIPVSLSRVRQPEVALVPSWEGKRLWRQAPLGMVGVLAAGVTTGGFWGMAPLSFQRMGFETPEITRLMLGVVFGAAAFQWPLGSLSDRGDRRWYIAGTAFAAAFTAALIGLIGKGNGDFLLYVGTLYGAAAFSLYGLSVAHVNDLLDAADRMAATESLLLVFGAGSLAGPMVGGGMMTLIGSAGLMVVFVATFVSVGAYALYRTRVRTAAPYEDRSIFIPIVRSSQASLVLDPRADAVEREEDYDSRFR
jgi:MFS family permease